MELPLQISFREMQPRPAVEALIRAKAAKLDRFFPHIIACRVVVEAPHRHHRGGRLFQVNIDLTLPGGEIALTRNGMPSRAHANLTTAIRDAFATATRRLQDHVHRLRHEVKTHAPPPRASMARPFPEAGYGFGELSLPNGPERPVLPPSNPASS